MTTPTPTPPEAPRPIDIRRILPTFVSVIALALAACADAATADPPGSAAPPDHTVTARDFGFDVPDLPAGALRLTLANDGAEPHHAQLFRLADDVSVDEFRAAVDSGSEPAIEATGRFVAGTGTVDPGGESEAEAILELEPGTYAFLCFIPAAEDGAPHFTKGMVELFDVTDAPAALPSIDSTDGTIALVDYGFDLPAMELPAGTYTIANRGEELHEMNVARLDDDTTFDEILSFLSSPPAGPPPFASIGGMQAVMPGSQAILALDLRPGRYLFLCYIPSATDGVPHVAKGMLREVTVTE